MVVRVISWIVFLRLTNDDPRRHTKGPELTRTPIAPSMRGRSGKSPCESQRLLAVVLWLRQSFGSDRRPPGSVSSLLRIRRARALHGQASRLVGGFVDATFASTSRIQNLLREDERPLLHDETDSKRSLHKLAQESEAETTALYLPENPRPETRKLPNRATRACRQSDSSHSLA